MEDPSGGATSTLMDPIRLEFGTYVVRLAETEAEIAEAQRLRYEIFSTDMPILLSRESEEQHRDHDPFDAHCDHLIAVESQSNLIVGNYRLMRGSSARKGIGFYCETEFDARGLYGLRGEVLELGRSCVRKEYRDKGIINILWEGIGAYIVRYHCSCLMGIVSIPVQQKPTPSDIYNFLKAHYWSSKGALLIPLPAKTFEITTPAEQITFRDLPALLKGYLRLGCRLIGAPSVDGDMTADFPILVDVSQIQPDYFARFTRHSL